MTAVRLSELPRSRSHGCPGCGRDHARRVVPDSPNHGPTLIRKCGNHRCPSAWFLTGDGGRLLDANPEALQVAVTRWMPHIQIFGRIRQSNVVNALTATKEA